MARFDNSPIQRHAIWTVHGEKCYQCGAPVDLQSMQVDHVIPKSLEREPEQLARVRQELGRSDGFDVHSFENLLPTCGPCNRRKSDTSWQPSLAVQRELQNAQAKAQQVERLIQETRKNRDVSVLLNELERMKAEGVLTNDHFAIISRLAQYQFSIRSAELKDEPVRIVKTITFGTVRETKDFTIMTMPSFTLTVGPGGGFFSNNVVCKSCGGSQFDLTRCIHCGTEN